MCVFVPVYKYVRMNEGSLSLEVTDSPELSMVKAGNKTLVL